MEHDTPSPLRAAGQPALDYFQRSCPSLPGVRRGGSDAEWLVDLTTQVGRLGGWAGGRAGGCLEVP